jgi:hypothetical protein
VTLTLQRNQCVELLPSLQLLIDMVDQVACNVINVVQAVPRLALQGTARQLREAEVGWACACCAWSGAAMQQHRSSHYVLPVHTALCAACCCAVQEGGAAALPAPHSYYDAISNDKDGILKSVQAIKNSVSSIAEPVHAALEHFEKRYKKLWDQDKDAYIRRYEKAQKPLSSYEADVTEYQHKAVCAGHCIYALTHFLSLCAPLGSCCAACCASCCANAVCNALILFSVKYKPRRRLPTFASCLWTAVPSSRLCLRTASCGRPNSQHC